MNNPSVFLSYSHDSAAHKAWVRKLAEDLRGQGVDATLDQWDLRPGADLVAFMEAGIRRADRVLLVCTSTYVRKAEERKGGAGYEGMIVTSHVARSTDTVKFIPLVRDNASAALPAFLGPRLWLDFRDDALYAETLEELLRELHDQPRFRKPPLGRPAFLAVPAEPPLSEPPPGPQGRHADAAAPSSAAAPAAPTTPWIALDPQPRQPQTTAQRPTPPPPAQPPPAAPPPALTPHSVQLETAQLLRVGNGWEVRRQPLRLEGALEGLGDGVNLPLVRIPAGEFEMGSPADELGRLEREGPQHRVRLESFWLGQTPITQAQWRVVAQWEPRAGERWGQELRPNPSAFTDQPDRDQRPVEQVSWQEALEFCARLSQRTGRMYTLPSEAQWEYACRAGKAAPFHFGDTITSSLVNYDGNYTYANGPKGEYRQQTTPVGLFPANAWGLQDMHGNVWEWCLDHWHDSYRGAPADGSAWTSGGDGSLRLLRGGSWDDGPGNCRSAFRNGALPVTRNRVVGFRVCCLPQD